MGTEYVLKQCQIFILKSETRYRRFQFPIQASFLIPAGDISRFEDYENYLSFIAPQCANFELVYVLLGDHEFYGTSRFEGSALAHRLENEERTLGNRPSLCVLGYTVQSHIRP